MVAKWSGVLSTTEPRNDIGILNVRQGNKNSEIAEFQIIENNKPYDLTGFTVLFCASFGMNQVEKPASVINAKEGKISYTFDDDAMQQVGRNKGYFSIKKAEAIIDSTQEFEYRIQSSIYSRLIDAKSYIFRLNELMQLLEDFVTNSQTNFSTWFDSVKEILYGVDPGGNILRELIEARNGILGKVFPSLKARLDTFETETTAQFQQIKNYKLDTMLNGNRFAGHRGCGYAPENTMASFELSKKMGFNIIETDLIITADDELVVFHDSTVDRMTDGVGSVKSLTLAEIKALNITAGTNLNDFPVQKIPTLEELLSWLKENNMYAFLEFKNVASENMVNKTYELLKKYSMLNRVIITSFFIGDLKMMRDKDENIVLALTMNGDIKQVHIDEANLKLKTNFGFVPYRSNLTKVGVELAHNNDSFVIIWDVSDIKQAQTAIKNLNVDYIVTDNISEVMYNGTF